MASRPHHCLKYHHVPTVLTVCSQRTESDAGRYFKIMSFIQISEKSVFSPLNVIVYALISANNFHFAGKL